MQVPREVKSTLEDALFQPDPTLGKPGKGKSAQSEKPIKESTKKRGKYTIKKAVVDDTDVSIEIEEITSNAKGKKRATASTTSSSLKKKKVEASLPPAPLPGGRWSSRSRKEISYGMILYYLS
jgi:hypothetical protein